MTFCEEEKTILQTVKNFARKRLHGIAGEIDKSGVFPEQTIGEMGELGIMGIMVPEKYGGFFKSYRLYYEVIREIARECPSHALTLLSHSFCAHIIEICGSDAQKCAFFPAIAKGRLGGIAMTEPDSGSDLSSIKTFAKEREDHFVLSGCKQFITNGNKSRLLVVLAATSVKNTLFSKSLFIVEKPADGLTTGTREKKMGLRAADTSAVFFDEVKVAKENILGKKGQGMMGILGALSCSRLAMASLALGIAESAFNSALAYSRQRKQFSTPLANFQMIQGYLADMATELECSRLLIANAAKVQAKEKDVLDKASMAKYFVTEAAVRIVSKALQIHGGYGCMEDFPLERHYRDVRLCTIIEGTSEIQRMVIAKNLSAHVGK